MTCGHIMNTVWSNERATKNTLTGTDQREDIEGYSCYNGKEEDNLTLGSEWIVLNFSGKEVYLLLKFIGNLMKDIIL